MSRLPTLTPDRSVSPPPPIVQPDHFYGSDVPQALPSPNSDRRGWFSPDDDPQAHRGIPVFKPTMEEFRDFEGYMKKVEAWGMRSGIVKVIPPKEWTEGLPSVIPQLREIQINRPIEQHMLGHGGVFRQENLEKRKFMSVREWVELCDSEEFRAPGVHEVGPRSQRGGNGSTTRTRKPKKKSGSVKAMSIGPGTTTVKEEPTDDSHHVREAGLSSSAAITPPVSSIVTRSNEGSARHRIESVPDAVDEKPKTRARRNQTKEQKEANRARDMAFVEGFEPHKDWLPLDTQASDYTVEFCQELERTYWRNLGIGRPAWYGADSQGSLFTDETECWNVAHLPSALSRLLPATDRGLPGVNTPYLYFGMWRATFSWHVEDMDLFSINYIHFGAPKFWYAIPQSRSCAFEEVMKARFPQDTSACPQFLRHKSFLASPSMLAKDSCRPNFLVQHAGEFVITFPRGYHAGLNLGLNCAESVNFALDSWLDIGRAAKACTCVDDSVMIDVDQLLRDRALEAGETYYAPPTPISDNRKPVATKATRQAKSRTTVKREVFDSVTISPNTSRTSRKRKSEGGDESGTLKRIKIKPSSNKSSSLTSSTASTSTAKSRFEGSRKQGSTPKKSVTLKLPPRPAEPEIFPCCLCISQNREGLLQVSDPPVGRRDILEAAGSPGVWMAHELCAKVVPETWVDDVEGPDGVKEAMVFGVDGIVRDRWNLKCSACTRNKPKAHGAPVQCTKGKCSKAFHISCARENPAIVFEMKEVEKDVILTDSAVAPMELGAGISVLSEKSDQVLKVIKKLEVQILCSQHNPAVAAEKKANKQEKIKKELLNLPAMSRVKIRVSAGVFEVSLIRVIEETGSVEVLWDRGLKKEFKWGSVVFGSTDGPVHQKPSEPASDPAVPQNIPPGSSLTIPLTTSVTQVSGLTNSAPSQNIAAASANLPTTSFSVPYYQLRAGYNYWPSSYSAGSTSYPYPYGGYFANVPTNGTTQYAPYLYGQQYRSEQLQWQQPYQGTSLQQIAQGVGQIAGSGPSQATMTNGQLTAVLAHGLPVERTLRTPVSGTEAQPPLATPTPTAAPAPPSPESNPSSPNSGISTPSVPTPQDSATPPAASIVAASEGGLAPQDSNNLSMDSSQPGFQLSAEMEQAILRNLHALSMMQPTQLAEILQSNPQLQAVFGAINQAKAGTLS